VSDVLELIGVGSLLLLGLVLVGLVWAALSLVFWVILLPFKLLGLAFRGVAVLFALPFLLIFGFLGVLLFGAGVLVFLLPVVPFALLVVAVVWLVRRSHGAASATS
jgi:hypothetical protein